MEDKSIVPMSSQKKLTSFFNQASSQKGNNEMEAEENTGDKSTSRPTQYEAAAEKEPDESDSDESAEEVSVAPAVTVYDTDEEEQYKQKHGKKKRRIVFMEGRSCPSLYR